MELVLSICLLASPVDCREEHIALSLEQFPPTQCQLVALQIIPQWSALHPKWKVSKWRCGPAGFVGQRI